MNSQVEKNLIIMSDLLSANKAEAKNVLDFPEGSTIPLYKRPAMLNDKARTEQMQISRSLELVKRLKQNYNQKKSGLSREEAIEWVRRLYESLQFIRFCFNGIDIKDEGLKIALDSLKKARLLVEKEIIIIDKG